MIACFGDSITEGRPGVTYLRYLDGAEKYYNMGLSGDTLLGLSKRVDQFRNNSVCDEFIIAIGCNDIMLPFLHDYSPKWTAVVDGLIDRGSRPLPRSADFIAEYEKLLSKLADKKVIVVSIPCIGENLKNELNARVDEYNGHLKKLCEKHGVYYVDFNGWQKEVIKSSGFESDYFMPKDTNHVKLDVLTTTFLGLSTMISNKRKLTVTVDGVHLNKQGAKGLANLINKTKAAS